MQIDAYAARAGAMHLVEIACFIYDHDGASASTEPPHRVQGAGIVGAVGARLHDDHAFDAERIVQRDQLLDRRGGRRVNALGGEGVTRRRSKNMDMAIARVLHNLMSRTCFARLPHSPMRKARSVPVETKRPPIFTYFSTRSGREPKPPTPTCLPCLRQQAMVRL